MRRPLSVVITWVALIGTAAAGGTAVTMASGTGAELPSAAYQAWCTTSKLCTYTIADSSGIRDLRTGRAAWVGEDEELTPSEARLAGGPIAYYPTLLSGIAVAINVPGINGQGVNLTGETLGDIFSGTVTNWNAGRIRATNRHLRLPTSLPITLCVPRRASGESWDMSEYLAKVSPTFRKRVGGESLKPRWKGDVVRVSHVSQMGECMAARKGGITFLPVADAMREGLTHDIVAVGKREKVTVKVGNTGKTKTVVRHVFIHPTEKAFQKAGHFAATNEKSDLTVDLTNSATPGAYPITIEAYAVVRKDRKMSAATRKTLAYFLSDKAQAMLPGLGYAPLPRSQLAQARQQLKTAR
ncbi:MAG: substrate-binding domain-containing protein [Actinomycetota bacterium]